MATDRPGRIHGAPLPHKDTSPRSGHRVPARGVRWIPDSGTVFLLLSFWTFFANLAIVNQLSFITNHGRVLIQVARDPDARLRLIGARLGITERRVHDIVNDLVESGYVAKTKVGRRNTYVIQARSLAPGSVEQGRAVTELFRVLNGIEEPIPDEVESLSP
jgi:hypothetical protein